jgi:hypothetical protein
MAALAPGVEVLKAPSARLSARRRALLVVTEEARMHAEELAAELYPLAHVVHVVLAADDEYFPAAQALALEEP